jgi:hypothetical protein
MQPHLEQSHTQRSGVRAEFSCAKRSAHPFTYKAKNYALAIDECRGPWPEGRI